MTDGTPPGAAGGTERDVCGVVLAGGRSTRFADGDKALAAVDGDPMLARVATGVDAVASGVVVNCRAEQRDRYASVLADADVDVRFAVDDRPDEGPVAGLSRALAAVDAPVVVVVACDLPWLDPDLLAWLVGELGAEGEEPAAAAGASGNDECAARTDASVEAVVPVDEDGYRTPTCAAYRTAPLAAAVEATLAAGSRRFRDVLEGVTVHEVDVRTVGFDPKALSDVDTRGDLPDGDDSRPGA